MKLKNILLALIGNFILFFSIYAQDNYKITEVPTEFTILAIQNEIAFNENWSIFQEAFKDTNIKLKGINSKNISDEMQAFNLAVTFDELPDIISLSQADKLEELGMRGGMLPLNDLIDKHAPNIKKFFEKYPRYKKDAIAADGNIYFIPDYYDWYVMKAAQGLYIRKDWLEKLNLEIPNTMEDFYNVLKAFKTQDPNGNGKNDEIPYFERSTEFVEKELIGLFGAEISFYIDENNKVQFGPTQERFKEAILEITKWYSEGLIDQEIFVRGFQTRDYILRNNLGGATFDWFSSTSSYNSDSSLKEQIKDFEFIPIDPPLYRGKRYAPDARPTYLGGWGITSSAKDPVSIIKYFDYWFSEKGYELSNWGIEGDTFLRYKDGRKYFTDKIIQAKNKTPLEALRDEGIQFRIGGMQDYNYEKAWSDPEANKWMERYTREGFLIEPMPTLKYTLEESEKLQTIKIELDSLVKDMCHKWILGVVNFNDTYDEFLMKLKTLGLSEAIQINQAAYNRFILQD